MRRAFSCALLVISSACGSDASAGDSFPVATAQQAIADYKTLVFRNYDAVLTAAEKLDAAIAGFVAAPSEATQQAAKDAWLAAREPYGPSEAFRFYDGPIDNAEEGPEGLINAWPLDENYIDYTRDAPTAGIVNDLANVPDLTKQVLSDANEAEGEKAISTGYHAIEFLLWGQDDAEPGSGPGKRPYTDYVVGEGGTAENQERRAAYLTLVSELLIDHLTTVKNAWDPADERNFAASFGVSDGEGSGPHAAEKGAIEKLLRSIGSMAKAELSGERMTVAFKNRSEEDEHSCFSDNTAKDLLGNGLGIQNVWLGTYGDFDGVGLDEVVSAVDAELADTTTQHIADAVNKLALLAELQDEGTPIDVILQAPDGSRESKAMLAAIKALKVVADDVEKAAAALGLSVQLEQASEEL